MYTLTCDYVLRSETGRFSAIDIYHNIHMEEFPGVKNPFCVLVGLTGDAGDEYSVSIEDPRGEVLSQLGEGMIEVPPELEEDRQWALNVLAEGAVVFGEPGRYCVVLREGQDVVHSHYVGVVENPKEQVDADETTDGH